VTMGIDNINTAQIVLRECHEYLIHITTRIDNSCLPGPFTTQDIAI